MSNDRDSARHFYFREHGSNTIGGSEPETYDQFGFLIRPGILVGPVSKTLQAKRSVKWTKMLDIVETVPLEQWPRKHRKFVSRLYKGIPSGVRTKMWGKMIHHMRRSNRIDLKPVYQELYSRPSVYERQIDLDIERTLRHHILFQVRFGSGQTSLFKVLMALANHNPKVGYCQGMSILAAFLLLYFDEETVFNHLVVLFISQSLDGLYSAGFPKLFESFFVHGQLLRHFHPRIHSHLEKHRIGTETYATKWYLTLFLCLPHPISLRIWDLFLFYGFDVFFHAGLAILRYFQTMLLKLDYEKSMEFLSRTEDFNMDPDKFIKLFKRTWIASLDDPSHSGSHYRSVYQKSFS